MQVLKVMVGVFLGVGLSACAMTGGSSARFHEVLADTVDQNGRACIRHSDIRGYGVLDHEVISIDGRRNYYLATVMPGCNSLETSPSALFESRFSEVCGGGMHKLYSDDDHCTLRQMFKFDSREEAFDAHRKAVETYDKLRESEQEKP